MPSKVVCACTLAAVLSIPPQLGIARDGPQPHASPWPIYKGFDHQPTEIELRALHEQDVAPAQAEVIDKLYDQLMSADEGFSATILNSLDHGSPLPRRPVERQRRSAEPEPIEMARDHAFEALGCLARPRCWGYFAPLVVGALAMAMVMEPAVSVRFLQLP
jgi:hypothetical protein